MADKSRLADLLRRHFPYDMLDVESGHEYRECECGFRFEEPAEWAQHAAARITADPTEDS